MFLLLVQVVVLVVALVTAAEVLIAAYHLLGSKDSWTQGTDARAADGRPVVPCDRDAVRWNVLGAVERVTEPGTLCTKACDALYVAAKQLYGTNAWRVNEDHGYAAVCRMFRRAIRDAGGKL